MFHRNQLLGVLSDFGRCTLIAGTLSLVACSNSPKVAPEPRLRTLALSAETEGARLYARADYIGALNRFSEAQKLQQSLDDPMAVARNQLHQARTEFALGRTEAALQRATAITREFLHVETLLFQAQANLALGRILTTNDQLTTLANVCDANCIQLGSLYLLQAHLALAEKRSNDALVLANKALPVLMEKQETTELANAHRLIARAQFALGNIPQALTAANAALVMDRQLGLPEKIARDWLLVGEIQLKTNAAQSQEAYMRALSVSKAAGLADIAKTATQALKENFP
jgi:tetratricopeptide (TPR) repeat protein